MVKTGYSPSRSLNSRSILSGCKISGTDQYSNIPETTLHRHKLKIEVVSKKTADFL